MGDEELFTFVIHPQAESTNNGSERHLRSPAQDRDSGRGSKTVHGARRRTVVASVLDSLRLSLPRFTLRAVLEELCRWRETGASCFHRLAASLSLPPPDPCRDAGDLLNRLIPEPAAA